MGTLILATLHSLWHIPLLLVTGPVSGAAFSIPFIVGYILTVIGATFFYSWVFNNTKGSLLVAVLVHASFNAASNLLSQLLASPQLHLSGWADTVVNGEWNGGNLIPFGLSALLLIIITKGKLSYKSSGENIVESNEHTAIKRRLTTEQYHPTKR